MLKPLRFLVVGLVLLAPLTACAADGGAVAGHRFVRVQLGPASGKPVSGRLLVFAIPSAEAKAMAKAGKVSQVDTSALKPTQVSVAAMDVEHLVPGAAVDVDTDALAFPAGFSALAPGEYALQTVLDVNGDYNYGGRGAGDLVSDVVTVRLGKGAPMPIVSLQRALPGNDDPWALPADAPQNVKDDSDAARKHAERVELISPALSAFWGRPIHLRGWVLPPPEYAAHPERRYPTVYYTHGFTGKLAHLIADAAMVDKRMRDGRMPPMIWVFLDESSPTGTHEFADSVNNGPWGKALTTELIPMLEKKYRMDGKASGRFLQGHSSGGWATLWLQTAYPKIFGGTWSTSPDPSDFHDFTGPDLYAADANVYRDSAGKARPLVRDKGQVVATFEQFARLERVIGRDGGQMSSFEWVFSPRGADGRPMPLFDRDTGKVDAAVVAYWRDNYDIAHRLQAQWPALKADLDGKIHIRVGDADTFYLDGAAHRFKAVLDGLGAKSDIRFLPGKTHFDLYAVGDDRRALMDTIGAEMYAVARPGEKWPRKDSKAGPAATKAAATP